MAKDMKFKENYPDYRQTLKQAGANESTHGLRYSYAKNRYIELKESELSERQTLAQISLEMGHSRTEITRHYLVGNF